MRKLSLIGLILSFCLNGFALNFNENNSDTTDYLFSSSWDNYLLWNLNKPSGSAATLDDFNGINNDGISVDFSLSSSGGWFDLSKAVDQSYDLDKPIVFFIKSNSADMLELKFTDTDGSVYGIKAMLSDYGGEGKHITVYLKNTGYWWGEIVSLIKYQHFQLPFPEMDQGPSGSMRLELENPVWKHLSLQLMIPIAHCRVLALLKGGMLQWWKKIHWF